MTGFDGKFCYGCERTRDLDDFGVTLGLDSTDDSLDPLCRECLGETPRYAPLSPRMGGGPMTWQVFDPDKLRATLTIGPATLALNGAALGLLGNPAEVTLLYDPDGPRVGLRAGNGQDPTVTVSRSGRGGKGGMLRAPLFIEHFKLPKAKRLPAELEEAILFANVPGGES